MATRDGKTADESWRDRADGLVTLAEHEATTVRAMLAFDRSDGMALTIRALGLRDAEELEAVVVHGAPPSLVLRARQRLARR